MFKLAQNVILIDLKMGWVLGVLALLALIKQTLLALVRM
jgi:hypothetical protein